MPIYAYKCDACGFAKDVLQKISDPVLTDCPSCGAAAFSKQLTAAGFQLKGSGWYVTDFRGGNAAAGEGSAPGTSAPATAPKTDAAASTASSAKTDSPAAAATPKSTPTPSAE